MSEEPETLLVLAAEDVPGALRDWLQSLGSDAVLASMEVMADGRLVLQSLPGVDPRLVARLRRTMAQHEDVLRRLT
jgi:xanthine dehydrogenase molybdopterin-binding subunit B